MPRQKLLPGEYGSQESRSAFARLQLELTAAPAATVVEPNGLPVPGRDARRGPPPAEPPQRTGAAGVFEAV